MKTIEERAYSLYASDECCRDCENCEDRVNCFDADYVWAFIAGAKSEHEELTKWNSPECPPEDDKLVIVKYRSRGFELYSIGDYDKNYGWSTQDEVRFNKDNIIGWREIHE